MIQLNVHHESHGAGSRTLVGPFDFLQFCSLWSGLQRLRVALLASVPIGTFASQSDTFASKDTMKALISYTVVSFCILFRFVSNSCIFLPCIVMGVVFLGKISDATCSSAVNVNFKSQKPCIKKPRLLSVYVMFHRCIVKWWIAWSAIGSLEVQIRWKLGSLRLQTAGDCRFLCRSQLGSLELQSRWKLGSLR